MSHEGDEGDEGVKMKSDCRRSAITKAVRTTAFVINITNFTPRCNRLFLAEPESLFPLPDGLNPRLQNSFHPDQDNS